MDYGRVLSRAGEITWRYKLLWILGFLVALGNGGGNASYRFSSSDFQNFNNGVPQFLTPPNLTGLLVGLGCLLFIVGLVVFVLSLIARGGLIAGVAQVEDTETFSLGSAWRAGASRFWTLLGIWFLTTFLPLVLVIGVAIIGIVAIAGTAGIAAFRQNANPGALAGGSIALLVACCCTSICGLILITIVLQQIRIYGERAAILEGRGAVAAFERGWQVLRDRFGPTLVLWLLFLLIGLVLAAIIFAVVLVVAIPFVIAGSSGQGSSWLALPAIAAALIGIVIGAVIGAIVQVFVSASWTLAYRELTGTTPVGVVPPGPATPGPGTPAPLPPASSAAAPPPVAAPSVEAPPAGMAPDEMPPAATPPAEPPLEVPPDDLPPEEPPRV